MLPNATVFLRRRRSSRSWYGSLPRDVPDLALTTTTTTIATATSTATATTTTTATATATTIITTATATDIVIVTTRVPYITRHQPMPHFAF